MISTRGLGRLGLKRIGAAALMLGVIAAPALARNPLKLPDTQYEPTTWPMVDGWADGCDDRNTLRICRRALRSLPAE